MPLHAPREMGFEGGDRFLSPPLYVCFKGVSEKTNLMGYRLAVAAPPCPCF